MRTLLIALVFIVLCLVSVLFFAQNNQDVVVSYFVGESNIPLAFVMVGSLIIGYLIGLLSLSSSVMKQKWRARRAEKELEDTREEIQNLRSLPLRDDY